MSTANFQAPDEQVPRLIHHSELSPVLDQPHLIENLLLPGSLALVYGPSNSCKTFIALNLAIHVARNCPWHDRSVAQGAVAYVALEGGSFFSNRIAAARNPLFLQSDTPLYIVNEWRGFESGRGVDKLIMVLKGVPNLQMVVIDTLSRAMAGYEENASTDISLVVADLDKLRRETGACVLVVHHTGKDPSRGARGHSIIQAAIDTGILVSRCEGDDTVIEIRPTKQRDLELGDAIYCRLQSVVLGHDTRGNQVRSCIVWPAIAPDLCGGRVTSSAPAVHQIAKSQKLDETEKLLSLLPKPSSTAWEKAALAKGIKKNKFYGLKKTLIDRGLVQNVDKTWELVPPLPPGIPPLPKVA